MNIKIISVGNLSPKFKHLFNDYAKNIGYFASLNVVEIKEQSKEKNIQVKKTKETQEIMSKIDKDAFVILLDLRGKMIDSAEFSDFFSKYQNINFIIGGSDGVDLSLIKPNYSLKVSDMTFPHQLFRIILAEQIYRSFCILNNKRYHK